MRAKPVWCCVLAGVAAYRVRHDEQGEDAFWLDVGNGADRREYSSDSDAHADKTSADELEVNKVNHNATVTSQLWDFTWLATDDGYKSFEVGQRAQYFNSVNTTNAPEWGQRLTTALTHLVNDLNDICKWVFFPSHGKQNQNGKQRVKKFNEEFLAHVQPPHKLVFFTIPRESIQDSSKHNMGVHRVDDRHGLRMAPTAQLSLEPFLERSPKYRRWCCCNDEQSCKWKYLSPTSPAQQCNTGWFKTNRPILRDDAECIKSVVNPDPNDAPAPPTSASDQVPRQCLPGQYTSGCPNQRWDCGTQRFCMGEDVQRDCGVACNGCGVVIPC